MSNPRSELLAGAEAAVNGDRNAAYGDPNQDFRRTADFWNTYLRGVAEREVANQPGVDEGLAKTLIFLVGRLLSPQDIAWMMILLKASRSTVSPENMDHYLDAAGYAACGWDCAHSEAEDREYRRSMMVGGWGEDEADS